MSLTQQIITIGLCVLGTMATRFIPFMVFSEKKKTPAFILYLGGVRYAGYLLSEKCGISTGKSWSARITCNSCNRCAPCAETTDAALHCGRHHLLYAVNTFYVNL